MPWGFCVLKLDAKCGKTRALVGGVAKVDVNLGRNHDVSIIGMSQPLFLCACIVNVCEFIAI